MANAVTVNQLLKNLQNLQLHHTETLPDQREKSFQIHTSHFLSGSEIVITYVSMNFGLSLIVKKTEFTTPVTP